MRSAVLGATGYVGRTLLDVLPANGVDAIGTSRVSQRSTFTVASRADLERVARDCDQVVVTAQLGAAGADWIVECVDGPRWLVFSSAQVVAETRAPGSDAAL